MPLLTDGKAHTFTIDVVSAESDHTTLQNWFVSGNLQVFTDPSGRPTTGKILHIDNKPFADTNVDGTVAVNGDLRFSVKATRSISVESEIVSGSGKKSVVSWKQDLQYLNSQQWLNDSVIQVCFDSITSAMTLIFEIQNMQQAATGVFSSRHNDQLALFDRFSYPLNINFTILNANGSDCKCDLLKHL